MKNLLLIGLGGGGLAYFLHKSHRMLSYAVVAVTAFLLFKFWRG